MLLSVRQLLNEMDDDDVTTISLLTSLVLPVAESLQRMRRAAERALATCVGDGQARDAVRDTVRDSRARPRTPSDVNQRAMVPYRGGVHTEMGLSDDDDYRLTLVAVESCDAAYRQIQVS